MHRKKNCLGSLMGIRRTRIPGFCFSNHLMASILDGWWFVAQTSVVSVSVAGRHPVKRAINRRKIIRII